MSVAAHPAKQPKSDPLLSRLGVDLIDVVAATLSGAAPRQSPEALSGTFLREVVRAAMAEGVELSEEDCIQLLSEAARIEVSVRVAEHVRKSIDKSLDITDAQNEWLAAGGVGWAGGYGWAKRWAS